MRLGAEERETIALGLARKEPFAQICCWESSPTDTGPRPYECLLDLCGDLPDIARRSLTWDQGREMADWVLLELDADIEVYVCDPHSPWQRPSNEHMNGLLHQYFPKGTDLNNVSRD